MDHNKDNRTTWRPLCSFHPLQKSPAQRSSRSHSHYFKSIGRRTMLVDPTAFALCISRDRSFKSMSERYGGLRVSQTHGCAKWRTCSVCPHERLLLTPLEIILWRKHCYEYHVIYFCWWSECRRPFRWCCTSTDRCLFFVLRPTEGHP